VCASACADATAAASDEPDDPAAARAAGAGAIIVPANPDAGPPAPPDTTRICDVGGTVAAAGPRDASVAVTAGRRECDHPAVAPVAGSAARGADAIGGGAGGGVRRRG